MNRRDMESIRQQGLWARACAMAEQTPESRNRYVDFLRALSIMAVVFGHWLMAAPFISENGIEISSMLEHQAWTRWLTWVFQVMPVFFLVGGYSNSISWLSAQRKGQSYAEWLQVRLQRLAGPVLPLISLWILLAAGAQWLGVHPVMVKVASQMALIPIWFLAVYIMVVLLVPVTVTAWQRFGLKSFWALAGAAVIDDVLFFSAGWRGVGWLNYAFVWLAVHQLGYAWRDGFLTGPRQGLLWVVGGAVVLIGMITIGPYPVSMVSVPGEEVSNTLPPKVSMLALGIVQCGLLLSFEAPMRRWLAHDRPWAGVILVNSMIMTMFLWHLTASTLAIGAALLAGGAGLHVQPGDAAWWLLRPVWILAYLAMLLPFALGFGRFERSAASAMALPSPRLVSGAILIGASLGLLALDGIAGDGWLGLRITVLAALILGAVLAAVNPLRKA
jgi:fucose 4-O-acetylase-like acetyltransferase